MNVTEKLNATDKLLALDDTKTIISHTVRFGPTSKDSQFSHSDCQNIEDPTGIAIEEGELLYGLVRTVKPLAVLETGTNIGVSASYIAIALRENGDGHLITIEKDGTVARKAQEKFDVMGLSETITVINSGTQEFFASMPANQTFDFLWLDTELKERYNELVTLFPHVTPGGIICIHDLWCLDHDWYGGVPDAMKAWIRNGDLRGLTIQTDHGVSVFQKRRTKDYFADLLSSL